MVLFLYARHHIPGTDVADTHHCIYHAVGKFNYHDDATIGFGRSDLHCWNLNTSSPRCCYHSRHSLVAMTDGLLDEWRRQASKGWFFYQAKEQGADRR
jgi:hypothetical protein